MELASARRRSTADASVAELRASDFAWLVAVPCALLTIAAILLLGHPLGRLLFEPDRHTVFEPRTPLVPKPTEHARFTLAVLGAFLLAAVVAAGRRRPALAPRRARALVVGAQAFAGGWLVVALLAQERVFPRNEEQADRIFTPRTLIAAAALAALALALLRREEIARALARRLRRETRLRAAVCALLAALLTALWLSTAINTETSVNGAVGSNLIPWYMDETFAVLDGRTPFVDFHAQYAQLWHYVAAAAIALAGDSSLAFWTTTMATISGVALLATYAVFRRVVRSSLSALLIYLPFLATTFFIGLKPLERRFSPAGIFSAWPLRYAGPYLLAWLAARHLDGAAPRRSWIVFGAAGLVLLNNAEFGIPAFAATLVALACARLPCGARRLAALGGEALAGLLGAVALVVLLTLARSGQLPHFGLLFEFPRLFGVDGWLLQRMPTLGLHIAVYMTFAAALAAAAARVAERDPERLLTGMLAWTGVFGLLAGSFYAGRSEPLQLIVLLSAWCYALALLLVLVVRRLAARGWRAPTLADLAVLFGFALAVCSIPQIPTPWSQAARLQTVYGPEPFVPARAIAAIRAATRPGEDVALLVPLGHRIAYRLHLRNVVPYSGAEAMSTLRQIDDTVAIVRRHPIRQVYVSIFDMSGDEPIPSIVAAFARAGYALERAVAGVFVLNERSRQGARRSGKTE